MASTSYVIGGGLAGMAAAWELAKTGRTVVLIEAGDRLGGKAGSEPHPIGTGPGEADYLSDHGYHLFPAWYENVRRIMGEIGMEYHRDLVEGTKFVNDGGQAAMEERDGVLGRRQPPKLRDIPEFAYFVLDLIATPSEELEKLTLTEFEESRTYPTTIVRQRMRSLILKALSNHSQQISAYSVAMMFRRWVLPPRQLWQPSWSALRGSLQRQFINRWEQALSTIGFPNEFVTICKKAPVTGLRLGDDPTRIVGFDVTTDEGSKPVTVEAEDDVVLAIPPDRLRDLVNGEAPVELNRLAKIGRLRVEPMSAVDVVFTDRVRGLPVEHFGFERPQAGAPLNFLTAFDISRNWTIDELPETALDPEDSTRVVKTILQVIATDTQWLDDLVLRQLSRYLAVRASLGKDATFDEVIEAIERKPHAAQSLAKGLATGRIPDLFAALPRGLTESPEGIEARIHGAIDNPNASTEDPRYPDSARIKRDLTLELEERTRLELGLDDAELLRQRLVAEQTVEFKRRVFTEVLAFVNSDPDQMVCIQEDATRIHLNTDAKLFMNDRDALPNRPEAGLYPGVANLYLAGDYCRTPIDVASMEGAVASGRIAAGAITGEAPDLTEAGDDVVRTARTVRRIVTPLYRVWVKIAGHRGS